MQLFRPRHVTGDSHMIVFPKQLKHTSSVQEGGGGERGRLTGLLPALLGGASCRSKHATGELELGTASARRSPVMNGPRCVQRPFWDAGMCFGASSCPVQ